MTVLVDTCVIVDFLRGHEPSRAVLEVARTKGALHASEVTRVEVLAGMRPREEDATRAFLAAFRWHAVDEVIAEEAGKLGRAWLPSHNGIDTADLVIAATATTLGANLLTCNVKHFPMFANLAKPY